MLRDANNPQHPQPVSSAHAARPSSTFGTWQCRSGCSHYNSTIDGCTSGGTTLPHRCTRYYSLLVLSLFLRIGRLCVQQVSVHITVARGCAEGYPATPFLHPWNAVPHPPPPPFPRPTRTRINSCNEIPSGTRNDGIPRSGGGRGCRPVVEAMRPMEGEGIRQPRVSMAVVSQRSRELVQLTN